MIFAGVVSAQVVDITVGDGLDTPHIDVGFGTLMGVAETCAVLALK